MLTYKPYSLKAFILNWHYYVYFDQLDLSTGLIAAGTIACGRGVAKGVGVKVIGLITLGLVVAAFCIEIQQSTCTSCRESVYC